MNRDELEKRLSHLIGMCPGGLDSCPLRQGCTCAEDITTAMAMIDEYTAGQNATNTELWTAEQVAEYLGQKGGAPAARSWCSRNDVDRVTTQSHPESGRPQAYYSANEVRAVCIKKGIKT